MILGMSGNGREWAMIGLYGIMTIIPLLALWQRLRDAKAEQADLWGTLRMAMIAAIIYGGIFLAMMGFPPALAGLVFIGFLLLIPISTCGLVGVIAFSWKQQDWAGLRLVTFIGAYIISLVGFFLVAYEVAHPAMATATTNTAQMILLRGPGGGAVVVSLAFPLAMLVHASAQLRRSERLVALAALTTAPGLFVFPAVLFLILTR